MLGTYMGTSQKWAVVAVDLDGRLSHGTTASLHLGEWIGHRAVIEELERRFAEGEIDSADVSPTEMRRTTRVVPSPKFRTRWPEPLASMTYTKASNNSRL